MQASAATATSALLDALESPALLLDAAQRVQGINLAARAWLMASPACSPAPALGALVDFTQLPPDAVLCALPEAAGGGHLLQRAAMASQIDPVSGLPSAAAAQITLFKVLDTRRQLGERTALIHLQCDLARRATAALGRRGAQAIEAAIATALRRHLRRGEFACSLGAGGFAIILLSVDQPETALAHAHRWVANLCAPLQVDEREWALSVCAGLAIAPEHGDSPLELFDHAASAAAAACTAGRGEIRTYSPAIASALSDDVELEAALAQAIARGDLELAYQPKLRAGSTEPMIVGAEALVRWRHPQRGPVSPARFVALAERCGLMLDLGDWIAERACAQQAEWKAAGLATVPVAINVSGQQLRQPGFRWQVESWLTRHRLAPADITLEITESALLEDVEASIRLLGALREMGVSIAIDDFGTGYSSLAYLRRFPCDLLKIDKTFIEGIERDRQAAGILQAIVTMAGVLDIALIVEGVEQEGQFRHLQRLGCELFQGYLFGRPEAPAVFAARWLRALDEPMQAA